MKRQKAKLLENSARLCVHAYGADHFGNLLEIAIDNAWLASKSRRRKS